MFGKFERCAINVRNNRAKGTSGIVDFRKTVSVTLFNALT